MLAMIFANNLILGRIEWKKVPRLLKKEVAEQLVLAGCEFLIDEDDRAELVKE